MKKSISLAPFAVACDGKVIFNLAAMDGPISPVALMNRALRGRGHLFVGVELSAAEVAVMLKSARSMFNEIAARTAGARQRQQRKLGPGTQTQQPGGIVRKQNER